MAYIKRILAIDDDPDALKILSEYLILEGYEVLTASDGDMGVELLGREEVQLVITDLNMPGLTGMDVIDIVRKNHPLVQVIVVTGYGTMETVLEALHKGAIDYLEKPFLLEILKLSLRKAERQYEIDQRLAELRAEPARDSTSSKDLAGLIEMLPDPLAVISAEGNLLAANPRFREVFGENDDEGLPALLKGRQRKLWQQLLEKPEESASELINLETDGQDLVLELTLHTLGDGRWLLNAQEVHWEEDLASTCPMGTMVVSSMGTLLWADAAAVEFFELDEYQGELSLFELFPQELRDTFRSAISDEQALSARRRWTCKLSTVDTYTIEVAVDVTPLLDDQDRRIASVIHLQRNLSGLSNQSFDRRRAVGRTVPLLNIDEDGRVSSASRAFLDLAACSVDEVRGEPLRELLRPAEQEGHYLFRAGKHSRELICQADSVTTGGRVMQFAQQPAAHLADQIMVQKEQLFRATSMLTSLLKGDSSANQLRSRLDDVARTVVDAGFFRRAFIFIHQGQDVQWGFAGYSEAEREQIRSDPDWLNLCAKPDETCLPLGMGKLVCPGYKGQTLPEAWGENYRLLLPVKRQDGEVIGYMRVTGNPRGVIPNAALVHVFELMLRQVAVSLDEIALEKHVRRTEEMYRALYDNARYPIVIVSLEDGRIMDVNRETERMMQYSREELVGRRIWETRTKDYQEESRRNWLSAVRHDVGRFENVPLACKDGTVVYTDYEVVYSEFDGRPVLQGFYRDVTEKQAMQYTLIQSQKLAGLGQLSAGIAHELRNPLGIINSSLFFVKQVLGKEERPISDQLHKHMGIMQNELDRAKKIIENLLSFSRVSNQEREAVDLNELLRVTLDLMKKELLVNNIRLLTDLAELPTVYLNLDELKQAFLNVILNSTQAMPEGGELTIRSRRESPQQVVIEFCDTGSGISKEDLANVFNPFFTTKDPGVGTGLGLSLTHSFIRRAGGDLTIESELNVGTTVRVFLPCTME